MVGKLRKLCSVKLKRALTTRALTMLLMCSFCSSKLEISVLTACSSCHTHTCNEDTDA